MNEEEFVPEEEADRADFLHDMMRDLKAEEELSNKQEDLIHEGYDDRK